MKIVELGQQARVSISQAIDEAIVDVREIAHDCREKVKRVAKKVRDAIVSSAERGRSSFRNVQRELSVHGFPGQGYMQRISRVFGRLLNNINSSIARIGSAVRSCFVQVRQNISQRSVLRRASASAVAHSMRKIPALVRRFFKKETPSAQKPTVARPVAEQVVAAPQIEDVAKGSAEIAAQDLPVAKDASEGSVEQKEKAVIAPQAEDIAEGSVEIAAQDLPVAKDASEGSVKIAEQSAPVAKAQRARKYRSHTPWKNATKTPSMKVCLQGTSRRRK